MPITEIFKKKGENFFRKEEEKEDPQKTILRWRSQV